MCCEEVVSLGGFWGNSVMLSELANKYHHGRNGNDAYVSGLEIKIWVSFVQKGC